ncbi:MAG TPA: isoprenylcysteine carboxylmethyltransferase family protein [Vicinamibacterales bacterium]|nr:isoprenylcysteine carboxylmethyltransferase family protein [Vicinamibacterales bacterium]
MLQLALFITAFLPMILESRVASRNEARLRAAGAVEPPHDVFATMRVVYPGSFLAMLLESWITGRSAPITLPAGIALFTAAKTLKYWAVVTLGTRWTFRVLVPPQSVRIVSGPYRFMRHPNYAGVIGELSGFALMAGAPLAGVAAVAAYIGLMRARIRIEERALGLR